MKINLNVDSLNIESFETGAVEGDVFAPRHTQEMNNPSCCYVCYVTGATHCWRCSDGLVVVDEPVLVDPADRA
jgi:hypothetical protein